MVLLLLLYCLFFGGFCWWFQRLCFEKRPHFTDVPFDVHAVIENETEDGMTLNVTWSSTSTRVGNYTFFWCTGHDPTNICKVSSSVHYLQWFSSAICQFFVFFYLNFLRASSVRSPHFISCAVSKPVGRAFHGWNKTACFGSMLQSQTHGNDCFSWSLCLIVC